MINKTYRMVKYIYSEGISDWAIEERVFFFWWKPVRQGLSYDEACRIINCI